MERKIPLIEGEYFHVYNRGVDKRKIFLDSHDYNRFLMLMYLCNSTKPVDMQALFNGGRTFINMFNVERENIFVDIGVWVLMPNHFHIVLRAKRKNGITEFMRKLCTGYSSYFNRKHERSGALFQGKFKSEHVENDQYLNYLFSYVHLNPVKLISGESMWKEDGLKNKNNAKDFITQYKYSSLPDYLGERRIYNTIVNKTLFSDINADFDVMTNVLFDWLK